MPVAIRVRALDKAKTLLVMPNLANFGKRMSRRIRQIQGFSPRYVKDLVEDTIPVAVHEGSQFWHRRQSNLPVNLEQTFYLLAPTQTANELGDFLAHTKCKNDSNAKPIFFFCYHPASRWQFPTYLELS